MVVISVIAAGAMVLCARILGSIESDDFNMRSVMLDTVADAAAAIGVAVSLIREVLDDLRRATHYSQVR